MEKKNEEELLKKGNISYEDLVKIVLNNKIELNKMNQELSKVKEEHAYSTKKLLEKIEKLERNQKINVLPNFIVSFKRYCKKYILFFC